MTHLRTYTTIGVQGSKQQVTPLACTQQSGTYDPVIVQAFTTMPDLYLVTRGAVRRMRARKPLLLCASVPLHRIGGVHGRVPAILADAMHYATQVSGPAQSPRAAFAERPLLLVHMSWCWRCRPQVRCLTCFGHVKDWLHGSKLEQRLKEPVGYPKSQAGRYTERSHRPR